MFQQMPALPFFFNGWNTNGSNGNFNNNVNNNVNNNFNSNINNNVNTNWNGNNNLNNLFNFLPSFNRLPKWQPPQWQQPQWNNFCPPQIYQKPQTRFIPFPIGFPIDRPVPFPVAVNRPIPMPFPVFIPVNNCWNPPPIEPPVCPPPVEPPVCPPPVEPPVCPPPETPGVVGSAGLVGDPYFQLYTTGLTIPNILKNFNSDIDPSDGLVSLLADADNGGFDLSVKTHLISGNNSNTAAVDYAQIKVGNDTIVFESDGRLLVNGVVRGNISDSGMIPPITLSNGTVLTQESIDDAQGNKKERFVIQNGQYKVTAAVRQANGTLPYLDMNVEELVANAANNATSAYKATLEGITNPSTGQTLQLGLADLLALEQNSPLLQQLS